MSFRRSWAPALLLAAVVALPLAADVIVLKNGRRIQAWDVQERGGRVYYETPAGEISLSKDLVERIERDGSVPDWGGEGLAAVADLPTADLPALNDADVLRVVEGGKVDPTLLAQLESEARRSGSEAARLRAAAAHALVGRLQLEQGQADSAAESVRLALSFAPRHPVLLLNQAVVEIERQRYAAAQDALRPLLGNPDYAFDAYRLQGWIYYRTEEMPRAIAAWKRALAARPDADLEARLGRIEKEARAAEDFEQRVSGRFVLRYEGAELASPRLATAILRALDAMYDRMSNTFDLVPREPIVVLLYPDETFYELTGLPLGVHGLYDGKIRVPIRGLSSLTSSLEQVLRHELVHAFVFYKSRGRARRWMQEGLAQYYAEQTPRVPREAFRSLFEPRDGTAVPRIEAAFNGSAEQVYAAYAASWLVVETLDRRYGRGDMERLLEALARGESAEQALRSAYRLSLVDLDRAVYDALR